MSQQQHQLEESLVEADGEEIQNIGYDNVAELNPRTEEKTNDAKGTRSIPTPKNDCVNKKISKDVVAKVHDDIAVQSRSSSGSQNDICRICHMGNNSSGGSSESRSSAQLELGLLVSACRCRGTVGLVHTRCLERWLTESGHTRCELCGYRYATIRVPRHGVLRSLLIWMKTFVATRQMFLDSIYLLVTTPLAVFSAYICAMTLKMALDNRIADIPWTIVAMLPTCSLTLVAYWGWILTLQRLHGRRWRQHWQSNFIVQLVPDIPIDDNQVDEPTNFYQDNLYDDLPELFNLM